ncbi:Sua5 family C-terminal domain-containing protein [Chromobacterium violaceum]|uniref:Sua5 family C-terminal domain-containing protein n=1 Tax=Chromobacterium violaceum TaxID=536 RepID=UPI003D0E4ACA
MRLAQTHAEHARGLRQALYAALHQADASGCQSVWIVLPPDEPAWRAVRDRLQRAARPLDGRHGS